jgi:DNA-binding LytR/AlgR family response regulator
MRVIIVDDEPKAINLLKSYLLHFNTIELVNTFRNALKALEFLRVNPVDLVFLDIDMPHLTGITLSKLLNPKIKIIFTTAYSKYAAESYDVEAVDYLLKPISFERFGKAIMKAVNSKVQAAQKTSRVHLIKSGSKIFRINIDEILYLKKDSNYIIYYFKDKKILARESINDALSNLPEYFVRSHRSYIVNLNKIEFINKDEISINKDLVPIGSAFKELLIAQINKIDS